VQFAAVPYHQIARLRRWCGLVLCGGFDGLFVALGSGFLLLGQLLLIEDLLELLEQTAYLPRRHLCNLKNLPEGARYPLPSASDEQAARDDFFVRLSPQQLIVADTLEHLFRGVGNILQQPHGIAVHIDLVVRGEEGHLLVLLRHGFALGTFEILLSAAVGAGGRGRDRRSELRAIEERIRAGTISATWEVVVAVRSRLRLRVHIRITEDLPARSAQEVARA